MRTAMTRLKSTRLPAAGSTFRGSAMARRGAQASRRAALCALAAVGLAACLPQAAPPVSVANPVQAGGAGSPAGSSA